MTDSMLDTDNADAFAPEIPEKFRDEAGGLRAEALLKSYGELERKLSGMLAVPDANASAEDYARFHRALGVPPTPEDYQIRFNQDGLRSDEEINRRLHAAGFTPAQAQLVYDLAVEHVLPEIERVGAEYEAERQGARLVEKFGGEQAWRETARALRAWGEANLPPPVLQALATTYEGVLALHAMMQKGEPGFAAGGARAAPLTESGLTEMMRDPRYWKTREPEFIARVTDGFKRLYPG